MLIRQPRIGIEVCDLWQQNGQMWMGPLPVPTAHDIERYVPYKERCYCSEMGHNFASRLASMTAQLEYDGLRLYASLWGSYSEGDYRFDGPATEDSAFVIRTAADYEAMLDYYRGDAYDDWDWSYQIVFAIASAALIK